MVSHHIIPSSFQRIDVQTPHSSPIKTEEILLESKTIPLLNSPPLTSLVQNNSNVVIAVTDVTRSSPDKLLLTLIRKELMRSNVQPKNITLLCATGLHRPMTQEEAIEKFGEENLADLQFINHQATDATQIADLGTLHEIPITVNRLCIEADLLIAIGVVEPHQYAGFSGGAKTVVIGCGGEQTIEATHGMTMLDREGIQLARVAENPFQEFVREAGINIGLQYVLNVVTNRFGDIVGAACGNPIDVHNHLASISLKECQVSVDFPAHAAMLGIPQSKGGNLYQTSRAATYLAFAESPPLLPGAPIILQASIPEGAGKGLGEKRFFDLLSSTTSPSDLIVEFQQKGFPAGAQRAYILAKTLLKHPVIVAGAEHPDVVEACHMEATPDLQSALIRTEEIVQKSFSSSTDYYNLLVVENSLTTLPKLNTRYL